MLRGKNSSGRTPLLNTLCLVLPLISAILLVLVIVAGVTPQALTQLYYFSVKVDGLNLDSKLSSSQFLKDLGKVSGSNLVGSSATAKSLGLSQRYTVHLLTSCGYDGDKTKCTTPEFGYAFDPRTDLKLDDTVLQGSFSKDLVDAIDNYEKLSPFVAGGHLASLIIMFIATVAVCFVGRAPKLGLVLMILSWIASILGLAASIAEVLGAKQFVSAFNNDLKEIGLSTAEGNLYYVSFAASILCLLSSILTTIKWRKASANSRRPYPRSGPGLTSGIITGEGFEKDDQPKASARNMGPKPLTLLQRIPTWGKHKYVQVEKQAAVVNPAQAQDDQAKGKRRAEEAVLMMDPMDERDEDDAAESEGPKAIAMKKIDPKPESRRASSEDDEGDVSLRTGGSFRDVAGESAYDPYSGASKLPARDA